MSKNRKIGVSGYFEKTEKEMAILQNINAFPVQRNSGIDGFLKEHTDSFPVPVKIQGEHESIEDTVGKLERATAGKNYPLKIVVQTKESDFGRLFDFQTDVVIIKSLELQAKDFAKRNV